MKIFNITFLFLLLIVQKVKTNNSIVESIENSILDSSTYNPAIAPKYQMQISMDIFFKQIVKLDPTNQILVSSSTLTAIWLDQRLAWNISEYPLGFISLQSKQIWLPDLYVINTADQNGFLLASSSNLAIVRNNGIVTMNYGLNSKYIKRIHFKMLKFHLYSRFEYTLFNECLQISI